MTGRRALRVLVPAMAFILGLWLGWQANTFIAEDICLDRGGVWAHHTRACDYGQPE